MAYDRKKYDSYILKRLLPLFFMPENNLYILFLCKRLDARDYVLSDFLFLGM